MWKIPRRHERGSKTVNGNKLFKVLCAIEKLSRSRPVGRNLLLNSINSKENRKPSEDSFMC